MIPHPEKAHRGGEDAYFNSSSMLVVADGVGGWNNHGIDPSKYSRFLCTAYISCNIEHKNTFSKIQSNILPSHYRSYFVLIKKMIISALRPWQL